MEYTLVQIIHLLCAIIFIGFIFADIFIFPAVKNKFGLETYTNMMSAIISRGMKIYPLIVLILISTGGYMFTKYINSEAGFFNTPFQMLLLLKVFLVLKSFSESTSLFPSILNTDIDWEASFVENIPLVIGR